MIKRLWDRAINFEIFGISPLVVALMTVTAAAVAGPALLAVWTRPMQAFQAMATAAILVGVVLWFKAHI
jgi:hypothetical protein